MQLGRLIDLQPVTIDGPGLIFVLPRLSQKVTSCLITLKIGAKL